MCELKSGDLCIQGSDTFAVIGLLTSSTCWPTPTIGSTGPLLWAALWTRREDRLVTGPVRGRGFCYGCNLGPSQTARCLKGVDRRQIAWVNQKYVTEENLDEAIIAI